MVCKPNSIQLTEVINCPPVCWNIIMTESNFMRVISLHLSGPVIWSSLSLIESYFILILPNFF